MSDHKDYTDDCDGNEFVVAVVRPFAAETYEAAWRHLTEELNAKG